MATRQANNADYFTAFSLWLRKQRELDSRVAKLDIQNLDYIIHGFGRNAAYLMLVEEKRFNGKQKSTQAETHSLLDQALAAFAGKIATMRGPKPLYYFGYHLLVFSGEGPDDSEVIRWDGTAITKQVLVRLLRFELNPLTLQPLEISTA